MFVLEEGKDQKWNLSGNDQQGKNRKCKC